MLTFYARRRIGWLTCVAAIAAAQGAGIRAQDRPTTFRASTRLVQVSVIVRDKDGKPLPGLTSADFQLYEDGKEQPIALFSVESDSAAGAAAHARASNEFTNRGATAPTAAGSVTVI